MNSDEVNNLVKLQATEGKAVFSEEEKYGRYSNLFYILYTGTVVGIQGRVG